MGLPKLLTSKPQQTTQATPAGAYLDAVDDVRTTDFSFAIAPWRLWKCFCHLAQPRRGKSHFCEMHQYEQKPGEAAESRHAMGMGLQPIQPAK